MIRLTADKKKYVVCHFWEDITLSQLIEAGRIPIPDNVTNFYLGKNELATIDPELINYYSEIITCFSSIPKSLLLNTEPDIIYNFVDIYLSHIVYTLVYNTPVVYKEGKYVIYSPPEITEFMIGKDKYYFPKTKQILGQPVLMADEQIISFVEACDLDLSINTITSDKLINLSLLMSIYCRRFREVYNQESVLNRAELFKQVTMDKVFALFFCIGIPSQRFLNNSQLSLKEIVMQKLKALTALAGGRLSMKLRKTELMERLQMSRN